ncbi:MAG TPA: DegT/DnrJ/EryC1/StrS family aminotransferase, partial [Acidimicrobiales bacterium]|nr:DegT/DnrJ/EryC1/StrS family aminotransferase [Acidimicrobiales bacterium]
RLSNLLAALGNGQLQSLPARIARRRAINARYRQALGPLPGIRFLDEAAYGTSTHWLTCMTVDAASAGATSGELCRHLEAYNIESRPVWKPLHLQPALAHVPSVGGEVSEGIFRTGLCLPSGSSLSDEDQERVVTALLERLRPAG